MKASMNLASTSHAGLKNSSYSSEFKLKAVRFPDDCSSNQKAAAKFGVNCNRIRRMAAKEILAWHN